MNTLPECTKHGYTSPHDARTKGANMGNSFRVYLCEECKLWHITKQRYGNLECPGSHKEAGAFSCPHTGTKKPPCTNARGLSYWARASC